MEENSGEGKNNDDIVNSKEEIVVGVVVRGGTQDGEGQLEGAGE